MNPMKYVTEIACQSTKRLFSFLRSLDRFQ